MKNFSLNRRILVPFSILFFCMILLVSLILNFYVRENARRQNQSHLSAYAASISLQTRSLMDNLNRISVQMYFSRDITQAMSEARRSLGSDNYFVKHLSAARKLEDGAYTIAGMDITDIIINLFNERGFFSSKYYSISWDKVGESRRQGHLNELESTLSEQAFAIGKIEGCYWTNMRVSVNSYIYFARHVQDYTTRKNVGTVELLVPLKRFEELLQAGATDQLTLLMAPDGQILCASTASDETYINCINTLRESNIKLSTASSMLSLGGERYYCGSSAIAGYGFFVLTLQRYSASEYLGYTLIMVTMGLLLYMLSFGMCILISRRISQPMNRIVSRLRNVSWGQLEMNLQLDEQYGDFDVLEESYSAMMRKLHESINLLIDSRLNEQKATYLALQSQISPHFIYNTIANISACAYENGIFKIVDICDKLCGLLRYATDYSEALSVISSELEYTENYLELMKIRYEGCFFYSIISTNDCLNVHIPRLMIQTIIENCFKHSFQNLPAPWFISVNAYTDNRWWLIDVEYNGSAISSDRLDDILRQSEYLYKNIASGLEQLNLGGLGLLNSITRLRMLCGNEIRFETFVNENGVNVTRFGGKYR